MTKRLLLIALLGCLAVAALLGARHFLAQQATHDANPHTALKTPGKLYTGLPDKQDPYYRKQSQNLQTFSNTMAPTKQQLHYGDVWLRDIAPVVTNDRIVKFNYTPDYLEGGFNDEINQRFDQWLTRQQLDITYSDLRLDGGNVVYNEKDTVILTTRILDDNPDNTEAELKAKLKDLLQVKHVTFIPEEPGDVLGHADGMVFFIQPDVLFVGEFEGADIVTDQLKAEYPELDIVSIPSAYTEKGQYDGKIPSAKGLYTNMLATETQIFVPQYGLDQDQAIIKTTKKYTDKEVIPVDVADISTMGGSVHCLTWYLPERWT